MKQINEAVQALEIDIGFWRPFWILLKKLKNIKKKQGQMYAISLWYYNFKNLKLNINPFVTSPGDLRDLGRPFRYEARRSPGLITWDNYDVIK